MSNLRGIKAGDTVFVVCQQRPYIRQLPNITFTEIVVRVGRAYGYLRRHGGDVPFNLDTGESHHPNDSTARVGGRGFDVYKSEDEWRKKEAEKLEFARLQDRLVERGGRLFQLSPEKVAAIHSILDSEKT